jgi:hypothetical protein
MTRDEIAHDQKKKLFNLLSQLNDQEVILLKFYSLGIGKEQNHPFKEKHKDIVIPPTEEQPNTHDENNKASFFYNYINTLDSLALVDKQGSKDFKRIPEIVTLIGKLLLNYIEVPDETEENAKD